MIDALALLAAIAGQTPGDPASRWLAATDDSTTAAVLMFSEGSSISVLCRDSRLQLLIGGLPAATTPTRTLQINYREGPLQNSTWISGSDQTTAISTAPAILARRLMAGGQFVVRVPPEGEARGRRYEMPLPGEVEILGRALDACDVARDRAEDADYDPTEPVITWEKPPVPEFPRDARARDGAVSVTCLAQPDGSVRNCRINTETPTGRGFGRAALASVRRSTISAIDGGPVGENQEVSFSVRFRLPR